MLEAGTESYKSLRTCIEILIVKLFKMILTKLETLVGNIVSLLKGQSVFLKNQHILMCY